MRVVTAFVRWFLALLFLTAGLSKLLDNRGFAAVLVTYQWDIAPEILLVLALVVAQAEVVTGFCIARGLQLRFCYWLTFVFHVAYALATWSAYSRGLALTNCGCFGVFWGRPLQWYTPLEDTVLAVISCIAIYGENRSTSGASNRSSP